MYTFSDSENLETHFIKGQIEGINVEPKKILIVEDEADIASLVKYHLQKAGFRTDIAPDGETALRLADSFQPDLVILDLMLPKVDGFEVCKELRKRKDTQNLPIIMLTAKGDEVDRVVGLEMGADDYVVKPFSPRELILRVRAILKRVGPQTEETEVITAGDVKVDTGSHKVWAGPDEVTLTSTEFKLLLTLLQNQGKVLTRDRLLDLVWDYHYDGYARTVDTHVRRLRQKLGDQGSAIETVWGVGYRYKE